MRNYECMRIYELDKDAHKFIREFELFVDSNRQYFYVKNM